MTASILLLGQAPSRTSGHMPLDGRSGQRLADLSGLDDVADVFAVGNLLAFYPGRKRGEGDAFPLDLARRNALAMMETLLEFHAIVLLGRNVARVFGAEKRPYFEWDSGLRLQGWCLPTPTAVFPHPSGVSRFWNESENVENASEFMRRLLVSSLRLRELDVPSIAPTYCDGPRVAA